MSFSEIIIRLAAVAVLSGYLYNTHRQRIHSRPGRYDATEWTEKGIDVSQLKPSVEEVRRDYLAARRSAKDTFFRRSLLGLARRAVARLAYFHDREPEEHPQTHGH
jgi:hypothetical protein